MKRKCLIQQMICDYFVFLLHALSEQGAARLTKEDIEKVFSLYDRVSVKNY